MPCFLKFVNVRTLLFPHNEKADPARNVRLMFHVKSSREVEDQAGHQRQTHHAANGTAQAKAAAAEQQQQHQQKDEQVHV